MITHASSPAARWPAALKVTGAIGLILVVTLTPAARSTWFATETVLLLLVLLLAKVPPLAVLRRLLLLSPFVAGAALAAAFSAHGADWKILALRSSLCLVTVIVLAQITTFSELLGVLRDARVPALLITTLTLMQRYLFVLADESARMNRARSARTFTRSRRFAWVTAASVVGQLFVRSSERAERVYDAMCARGWKS
jgi:cobalt/nickel transport system permease protein